MMRLVPTLTLFLGVACTAYAQSTRQMAEPVQTKAYEQTLPYRTLRGTSPDACAAACAGDNVCQAWVLTPPTFSRAPKCELRTTSAFTEVHPAAVTGVIERRAKEASAARQRTEVPDSALAGAAPQEQPVTSVRTTTPAPTQVQPSPQPVRARPAPPPENIPFSQREITVESYPVGYEPDPVMTAPAPTPKPQPVARPVEVEREVVTEAPVRTAPAPATAPEPAPQTAPAPVTAEPTTHTETRTTTQAPVPAREMVTTRADSAPQSVDAQTETHLSAPRPVETTSPAQVETTTSSASAPGSSAGTTSAPQAAATEPRDHPWPGLRRSSKERAPVPAGERPLPGRNRDGGASYSVQGMETLPGDYEDNAGLQGRLPAGHIDPPEDAEAEGSDAGSDDS